MLPYKILGTTVGDTDFKNSYSAVNMNMEWSTLLPFVNQAMEEYLIPVLGKTFYESIASSYLANTLHANNQKSLELIQNCLAYYTIADALPHLNIVISDMGVQENVSREGTSNPIALWRYRTAALSAMDKADQLLDKLLQHLESQVEANITQVAGWKTSPEYSQDVAVFFRTTQELRDVLGINHTRRTFRSLITWLNLAASNVIKPVLCDDLYADIKNKYVNNLAMSSIEKELLENIKKAAAFTALGNALPHLRVSFEGGNLRVKSAVFFMNSDKEASQDVINELRQNTTNTSKTAIADLRVFLRKNEASFPLWANSACNVKQVDKSNLGNLPEFSGAMGL